MGSEVIMRGNVSWYLASVDTARPAAPNIARQRHGCSLETHSGTMMA